MTIRITEAMGDQAAISAKLLHSVASSASTPTDAVKNEGDVSGCCTVTGLCSIVVCSVDSLKFSSVCKMYERLLGEYPFEIVAIHDARGLAEGYNRGLAQARGEWVIFSHDDVRFETGTFHNTLAGHMQYCDILGVAGTSRLSGAKWVRSGIPYLYGQFASPNAQTGKLEVSIWSVPSPRIDSMEALDGVFLCAKREVARAVGFDADAFPGFHLYDIDFTYRAFLAGHKLAVATDLFPIHESAGKHDQRWAADAKRFEAKHGKDLKSVPQRPCLATVVAVAGAEEMVDVMTPPHWRA